MRRKILRNANIDYRHGRFFVTCQVSWNKSLFGAIVADKCVLNEFGREVERCWRELPTKCPELELGEFVVMPNHFHAIVSIRRCASNRHNHLGYLVGRFKGATARLYGKLRETGEVADIGEHLWEFDYWDDLITSEEELKAFSRYIRENPANWSRDRWGAVTSHSRGNLALLSREKIAFVASQGFWASELRPRRVWVRAGGAKGSGAKGSGAEAPHFDQENAANHAANHALESANAANNAARSKCEASASLSRPIISTFTSAQEREALRRALSKGKSVIQVFPQGIPDEDELSPALRRALAANRALLLSPQATGSRLTKQVATWCNEYVLRQASEVWVGDIAPNGMLATMLKGLALA